MACWCSPAPWPPAASSARPTPWSTRCSARPARDVVRVFALEYALLGAFSALLATGVGVAGAYGMTKVVQMDVGFSVDPVLVVCVLLGSVVLTIITGALTTWSALSTRPAQYLRAQG